MVRRRRSPSEGCFLVDAPNLPAVWEVSNSASSHLLHSDSETSCPILSCAYLSEAQRIKDAGGHICLGGGKRAGFFCQKTMRNQKSQL